MFGDEQAAYSVFFVLAESLPVVSKNEIDESWVCGLENKNNELNNAKTLHRAEDYLRVSDNSPWVTP